MEAAPAILRREEVQRAIAPIEDLWHRRDRHELEHIDAQTEEAVQPLGHAIERTIELFDLQFVDNEVIQFRDDKVGIRRPERQQWLVADGKGRELPDARVPGE